MKENISKPNISQGTFGSPFKNYLFLEFKKPAYETEFINYLDRSIWYLGKVFAFLLFIYSLYDFLYQHFHYTDANLKGVKWIDLSYICSICVLSFSIILCFLNFILKNKKVLRFSCFCIYLLFSFPSLHVRKLTLIIEELDYNSYSFIWILDFIIRIFMSINLIISIHEVFYLNFIIIIIISVYYPLIQNSNDILFNIVIILLHTSITYSRNLCFKLAFFSRLDLEKANKWNFNLLEHLNFGLISVKSKKINLLNLYLLEYLHKNKLALQILKERNPTKYCCLRINPEDTSSMTQNVINNSEEVLKILLRNIHTDYSLKQEDETNSMLINDKREEFNLDLMLDNLRKKYCIKKMESKFMFLGYKYFEIENVDENNKLKKEIRRFEVLFRIRNLGYSIEEEIEFIFNDISKIKQLEEESAELKYKTMFLSKVAHEFKNPLICISELINEIQENNSNKLENLKYLKQVKAMSDYLILLIKDLDYFAYIQIKKDLPPLDIEDTNVNEVTDLCKQIAEGLIFKYNKGSSINFEIENNLEGFNNIYTDRVKLTQILINLISNSIKFTNQGKIKLIINYDSTDNKLIFQVEDSGIGISEEQISKISTPFNKMTGNDNKYGTGLGLNIVSQMLNQLGAVLEIKSCIGHGSSFIFSLDAPNLNVIDSNSDSISILNKIELLSQMSINANTPSRELSEVSDLTIKFVKETISESDQINLNTYRKHLDYSRDKLNHSMSSKNNNNNMHFVKQALNLIVVDDERYTRISAVRILKKSADILKINLTIIEAEDGVECLYEVYKSIKKGIKISGIISDECMNHMNGSELAKILKNIKNLNTDVIPFYLLSSMTILQSEHMKNILNKPLEEKEAIKLLTNLNF